METLKMSAKERHRLDALNRVKRREISVVEAAELMAVSLRQARRLWKRFKSGSDRGLIHKLRGRTSNHRFSEELRDKIVRWHQERYQDFGPTLACEKLAEEGLVLSPDTLTAILKERHLWKPMRRRKKHRRRRERRKNFGAMIQIDGSHHDWFEGRAPRCTLIVFIDDATGQLTALRFAPVESGAAYLAALRDHVLTHGRPQAFYSDRHGIFRVNAKDAANGDGKTEFGRVVDRLEIGLINALTPQAKGRVERANQTLQDRLIKEMRLRNISSMQAGQAFLPSFMVAWNGRFAVPPSDPVPAHRPWTQTEDALDLLLARHEERVLSKALTFSYGGTKYCVNTGGAGTALRGAKVMVHHFADDRLRVMYKDRILALTAYGSYPVPDAPASEKTLDARVDAIIAARKPAHAIVSGRGGGIKPGAQGAPLRGVGA